MDFLTGGALNAIFGIAALIGAAIAGLIYSNTTTLRSSNADLRDRVTDLEKENTEHEAKIQLQSHEIAALQRTVRGDKFLEEMVREMRAFSRELKEHTKEARAYWASTAERRQHAEMMTARVETAILHFERAMTKGGDSPDSRNR